MKKAALSAHKHEIVCLDFTKIITEPPFEHDLAFKGLLSRLRLQMVFKLTQYVT